MEPFKLEEDEEEGREGVVEAVVAENRGGAGEVKETERRGEGETRLRRSTNCFNLKD